MFIYCLQKLKRGTYLQLGLTYNLMIKVKMYSALILLSVDPVPPSVFAF